MTWITPLSETDIAYVKEHARRNLKAYKEKNRLYADLQRPGLKPRPGQRHPDLAAVRALKPGEGVMFPCRWRHALIAGPANGTKADRVGRECNGIKSARNAAKYEGFRVLALCEEGIVKVVRVG